MKKIFFLFLFFCLFTQAENKLFQEAFNHLSKKEFTQVEKLLFEILNQNPQSEEAKYNLAYTFLLKNERAKALAYQRQVFFQNPYHKPIIREEKKWFLFWLYISVDFVLMVLFIMNCIFLFFLYKKKYKLFQFWLIPWIIAHGTGVAYTFHRYGVNYVTLVQDAPVLSAPDLNATVLFEQEAGALLRVKNTNKEFSHVQNRHQHGGWVSSQMLIPVRIKSD